MIGSILNKSKFCLVLGLVVFFCLFLVHKCTNEKQVKRAVKNSTKVVAPKPVKKYDTVYIPDTKIVERIVLKKDVFNEALLERYKRSYDSVVRLNLYKEAITQREYLEVLEDSFQTVKFRGFVTGSLDSLNLSYELKKPLVLKTIKEHKKALYLGIRYEGNSDGLGSPSMGVNAAYSNGRTMYTFGVNDKKNVSLGVSINILNPKRKR